jgi:alpha-L-fucosidase
MSEAAGRVKPYEPTWESLSSYRVPEWYLDAKLGIFIHWGVYAVPAFDSEWYPRNMYRRDHRAFAHHREKWGPQSEFGYKDFIPMFKAERWDPEAWVDLFEESGARYIVPVAEHHDGFPMYATSLTEWNAARMGPRRDVIPELERAVRARGLKFGVSSHRAFNWRYYTYERDFDTSNPAHAGLYSPAHPEDQPASAEFLADWLARTKELIDRFRPDVLWFDFCWHHDEFEPYRPQVAAYYYNRAREWGKGVVLNYKDKFPDGTAVLDIERGKLDSLREHYWQTDTSVSYKSWGYIEDDEFKSVTTVVHDLVDIVSKNGNLLLNVGPRPDGTIPEAAAAVLRGLGEWLKVNGEAVYGTRPWRTYGEGPTAVTAGHMKEREDQPFTFRDIRFTTKGSALYAICLGWPEGELRIESLGAGASRVSSVRMVGSQEKVSWSQEQGGLRITRPKQKPCDHAYVFEIAVAGAS